MKKRARIRSNNDTVSSQKTLASVTNCERDFFWGWCKERYIDDSYIVNSILIWIRSKNKLSVSFLLRDFNKELYMKLCIHLSLKWNGYDEIHKCNFLYDLKCTYPGITQKEHWEMELEILSILEWDI